VGAKIHPNSETFICFSHTKLLSEALELDANYFFSPNSILKMQIEALDTEENSYLASYSTYRHGMYDNR
jgi:hypothetical protein